MNVYGRSGIHTYVRLATGPTVTLLMVWKSNQNHTIAPTYFIIKYSLETKPTPSTYYSTQTNPNFLLSSSQTNQINSFNPNKPVSNDYVKFSPTSLVAPLLTWGTYEVQAIHYFTHNSCQSKKSQSISIKFYSVNAWFYF